MWEIEGTDEFSTWYDGLTDEQAEAVNLAVDTLAITGPGTGRPLVDTVKGSRHHNMKELRPRGGNLRIFFAFDPIRNAILLIGGDKANRWQMFYDEMIPVADDLYDEHLEQLRKEGLL